MKHVYRKDLRLVYLHLIFPCLLIKWSCKAIGKEKQMTYKFFRKNS